MSTCGKVRYPSRKRARAARRTRDLAGSLLRAYLCSECGGWHLGHLPKSVRQRGEVFFTDKKAR